MIEWQFPVTIILLSALGIGMILDFLGIYPFNKKGEKDTE